MKRREQGSKPPHFQKVWPASSLHNGIVLLLCHQASSTQQSPKPHTIGTLNVSLGICFRKDPLKQRCFTGIFVSQHHSERLLNESQNQPCRPRGMEEAKYSRAPENWGKTGLALEELNSLSKQSQKGWFPLPSIDNWNIDPGMQPASTESTPPYSRTRPVKGISKSPTPGHPHLGGSPKTKPA